MLPFPSSLLRVASGQTQEGRKRARQEHERRSEPKAVGGELTDKSSVGEQAFHAGHRVSAEVACVLVVALPQQAVGWDAHVDSSRWNQMVADLGEKGDIVLDVLDDVEESDCGD